MGTAAWITGGYGSGFWAAAALVALASAAVGVVMAGSVLLMGAAGFALAALVIVLVDLVSSGGPVGSQLLPDFYRWVAPWMPAGELYGAMRGALYFDGAGVGRPVLVLGGWLLGGLVLLPLGERWGYCDAWPAHALYASHVARTEVFLHEDELPAYPPEVRRHAMATGPGPWRRLDLTGWSRMVRGIPAYPQDRACNGLAEGLAARYGDHRLIRVVEWGRADRWTGRRT